jgi:CheY-like chemotaxis protein
MTPIAFIVEDDAATRSALAEILRAAEWTAYELADGIDCVALLATVEPDAIIIDLDLPVFDGERLVDYLHGTAPQLLERTVIVTGSLPFLRHRDWPVRATLTKPLDPQALLRAIGAR